MRTSVRAGIVTVLAAATLALSATSVSAGGYLCNVDRNTQVFRTAGNGGYMYTIPKGGGFRLVGYTHYGYWYGHGNGKANGWIKDDGRLYNC
jgi:hypothetical protein